jgi:hypothetical protein
MQPDRVIERDGWEIGLTYLGEASHSPLLITDLSHIQKWNLQSHDLNNIRPAGVNIPLRPGEATLNRGILIVRLTPWECRIMVLDNKTVEFKDHAYTEITDGYSSFAVVGLQCLEILNKLSAVDMEVLGQTLPCAAQAPVENLTCLIIRLQGHNKIPGLIILGARGYGEFLLDIFQDAGKEYGLLVAGWERFEHWLKSSTTPKKGGLNGDLKKV